MSNKIEDLRGHLFDQLIKLKTADGKTLNEEVSRSAAIVSISQQIIETARAETEFLKVSNEFQQVPSLGTGFIGVSENKKLSA